MFQTGDVLYGEGKLRDLGMVFKPSFKCLKNKKINLSPAFLKLETLLFQNMFLLFHLILYSQSDFDSKKKKSGLREKKHARCVNGYFLKNYLAATLDCCFTRSIGRRWSHLESIILSGTGVNVITKF